MFEAKVGIMMNYIGIFFVILKSNNSCERNTHGARAKLEFDFHIIDQTGGTQTSGRQRHEFGGFLPSFG